MNNVIYMYKGNKQRALSSEKDILYTIYYALPKIRCCGKYCSFPMENVV